jgi:hypothetical protein
MGTKSSYDLRPRPPAIEEDDEPTQLSDSATREAADVASAPVAALAPDHEAPAANVKAPAANDDGATSPANESTSDPQASPIFVGSAPPAQGFAPVAADVKTPISHISEMSVGSYAGPPRRSLPPKRSLILIAAVLAGVLMATVIGLAIVIRSGSKAEAEPGAATQAVEPVTTRSAPPKAATADEPTAVPTAVPVQPPAASASVAADAEKQPAPPTPTKPTEPAKPVVAGPVVRPPPKADCNPPFTTEDGIKKFKRHCL